MKEVFRSRAYAPDRVARRFVAYWPAARAYRLYETTRSGLTIRETETPGQELPERVKRAARCTPHRVAL